MTEAAAELDAFRRDVAAWLSANKPADPGFLLPESFMEVGADRQFDFLRAWQRKVYEAGYLGMAWPTAYGGRGMAQVYQDIATEEMARQRVPFMLNTIGLNWAGPLLLQMGSEDDKRRYIKGILSAEDIWCQGFSEPDHGSDLGAVQCRAVREGDDYVIEGSKIWTSLGMYASYMILLARTSTAGPSKYDGLSFFLAPMKAKGIEVRPIRKLTGEYGFCQVYFDKARIPASCRMGKEGEGWRIAMATLAFERGAAGGQAGGLAFMDLNVRDVVELARRTKRNGKPAIDDPLIRDQLVQFLIESEGNGLMNARAGVQALGHDWPQAIPLTAKLRQSELKRRMCQFALALQGANGARFIGEGDIVGGLEGGKWQRSYLNAFSSTIGGGTSEIQRNIVGERVLGLPKS